MHFFNRHLLMLVASGCAVTASAQSTNVELTLVDDQLSSNNVAAWWSPIAVDPFDGSVYLSYLRSNDALVGADEVWLARRDDQGLWTHANTGGEAAYDRGHTQASVTIDGDGFAHVFYGMHGRSIRYRQANAARSITAGFTYAQPPAFDGGSFTYPNITTDHNGDLWLIIRDFPTGELYHYDTSATRWEFVDTFAGQGGTTVYPDQVLTGQDGRVHMIWEWAAGAAQASRHLGSYAGYDPSTGSYYKADGSAYEAGPITTATADTFQPLEGDEQFLSGEHGFQSAKFALDELGRPMVAYAYTPSGSDSAYEHRFARWDGTDWVRQTISTGPFSAEKPWIAYSDGLLRYYTMLPEADGNAGDLYLFTSDDLGQTWSDAIAITQGMSIERPVGVSFEGTDYLYLPSTTDGKLYLATVTVPEPSSLTGVLLCFLAPLARRARGSRDRTGTVVSSIAPTLLETAFFYQDRGIRPISNPS